MLKNRETFYKYNYNEKERLYSNTPTTTTPQTKKFTHNSELILSPLRYIPTKTTTTVRTCDRLLKILSSNSYVAVKRRISCKLSEKVCEQVRLDVDRAFCFDSGFLNSKSNILEKRNRLYNIIIEVLQRNPEFNYYQGFHEICSVFLIIFVDNDSLTVEAIDSFSNLFLRPFLCSNSFEKILSDFTEATISLSSRYSWKMGRVVRASEAEITSFNQMFNDVKEQIDLHGLVTSWFLTWFVHEFTNFNDIFHVFDFELYEMRSHLAPIYIASSMLMCEKNGLISWSGGCFELMMHIKTIPKHSNTTTIMECARNLFKIIPPEHVLIQFPTLHLSHQHKLKKKKKKKNKLKMFTFTHFGIEFWLILLTLHFLYFVLSSTLWPFLKNY